jgi:hypothetical protein
MMRIMREESLSIRSSKGIFRPPKLNHSKQLIASDGFSKVEPDSFENAMRDIIKLKAIKAVATPPAVLAEVFAKPFRPRGKTTPLMMNPTSGEMRIKAGRIE